jgi:hypothetical protein
MVAGKMGQFTEEVGAGAIKRYFIHRPVMFTSVNQQYIVGNAVSQFWKYRG